MTPAYPQPRLRPARRYIASTPEFCDANEMQSSSSPYATARMPRGVEARCFCCPSTLVKCRRFNVAFPSSSPPPQAKLPLTAPHPHGVFANKYPYARELACLNSMSCYCLFFFFFFFSYIAHLNSPSALIAHDTCRISSAPPNVSFCHAMHLLHTCRGRPNAKTIDCVLSPNPHWPSGLDSAIPASLTQWAKASSPLSQRGQTAGDK